MRSLGLNAAHIYRRHLQSVSCNTIDSVPRLQRTFSAGRALRKGNSQASSLDVKWFEGGLGSGSQKSRVVPDEEDPETHELRARILQLEEELKQLRDGGFLPKHEILAQMSEEDRIRVEKELQEAELEDVAEEERERVLDVYRAPSPAKSLGKNVDTTFMSGEKAFTVTVGATISSQDRVYLDQLNKSLSHVFKDFKDPNSRKEIWRWYSRCKQSIPTFVSSIPGKTWAILWESQYHLSSLKPDRMEHLRIFCDDMLSVGHSLNGRQRLSYIEALFLKGEHQRAISQWEAEQDGLGHDGGLVEEYWTAGVRMFVSQGEPQRAQEVATILLDEYGGKDASILVPVINAWNHLGETSAFQKAWALYVSLREQSGYAVCMEDYDTVSISFLKAGRKDLALAVFKDMILAGQDSTAKTTEALYRRSLGIVSSLQSTSVSSSQVNNISLEAMTVLPRTFQNKFFYGSWIKKLLGMGEVDAAAAVLELMYERGTRPDSKHVNGIIGAWLRSGTAEHRTKAETMAWAMIQERMDFAWRRRTHARTGKLLPKPSIGGGEDGVQVPLSIQRIVPSATVETFSIMVLYFLRRQKYAQVRHLQNLLGPAEIHPNSYFMNHLLYAELRSRGHLKAWQKYKHMTESVQPDLETFVCLWDCMKASVEEPKQLHGMGIFGSIGPRQLFCEMITWYMKLTAKDRDRVCGNFTHALYDQVIRCFCLSKDLEGTLVVLYAMCEIFVMYPSQDTARLIVLQVSRIDSAEATVQRRRRAGGNSKINVAKVTKVLDALFQRRRRALEEQGIDFDDFDAATKAKEQLHLLSSLLRIVLSHSGTPVDVIDGNVEKIAWEMGVGGMELGYPFSASEG